MDTSFHHERIVLSDPGQLIALVPQVLGFHPVNSIVVLNLGGEQGTTVCAAARADLPSRALYSDLAARLAMVLAAQDAHDAMLLIVAGAEQDGTLPHRDLLTKCTAQFAQVDIEIRHRIWSSGTVVGSPWRCYEDASCAGSVAEPVVVAGQPVCERREDIVASLAPVDDDTLARRADLLAGATDTGPSDDRLRLVEAAVDRAVADILPESDEDIVALAMALTDHVVRDACLAQPDEAHALAAERLWTTVVRGVPAPERAEPACLLGMCAYHRGNGVLAGIALDLAVLADPGHRLTYLIRTALSLGVLPSRMQAVATRAAEQARLQLDDTEEARDDDHRQSDAE